MVGWDWIYLIIPQQVALSICNLLEIEDEMLANFLWHLCRYGLFEADVGIKGSIAAFVGLYNKGKTFLLNKLSDVALPSGSKVTTRGISVKVPKAFDGQMVMFIKHAYFTFG